MDRHASPNIILISDGVPSKNGGGLSQTLYNIFDNYPAGRLFCIKDRHTAVEDPAFSLCCILIEANINVIPVLHNRIGSIINPLTQFLNSLIRDLHIPSVVNIETSDQSVLLVSTTSPDKLHFAYLLHQKLDIPLIPYFMDDWMANNKLNWGSGNLQQLTENVLQHSKALLMISDNLNSELCGRYDVASKPTLIVHNPVASSDQLFAIPRTPAENDLLSVVYAGSIWPFHYDPLLLVAKAINHLKSNRILNIELKIYCKDYFWNKYCPELIPLNTKHAGFVRYDDLGQALDPAHLLLVTSSFLESYRSISLSSVQTKLTDYMKMGKPVLSVGPSYGVCNGFVRKWDCGYIYENTDYLKLADTLVAISKDRDIYIQKSKNGFETVKAYFSKQVIQKKVYDFISSLF